MTSVVTWGGDAMPPGVSIEPAATSTRFMTRRRAEEVTERARISWQVTKAGAGGLVAALAEAHAGNAHQVLGFDSWHAYVEHVVDGGDLRDLRLSGSDEAVAVRAALAQSLHQHGVTYRKIRDLLGVSLGTIRNDIGTPASDGEVVEQHDELEEVDPYDGMGRKLEALARVAAQEEKGLTSIELDHETGWPMGTATGALSKLARSGLVNQPGHKRGNRGAYVATETGVELLATLRGPR